MSELKFVSEEEFVDRLGALLLSFEKDECISRFAFLDVLNLHTADDIPIDVRLSSIITGIGATQQSESSSNEAMREDFSLTLHQLSSGLYTTLKKISSRSSATLGNLDADELIVFCFALFQDIPQNVIYNEVSFSNLLGQLLTPFDRIVRTDFAELRRLLADFDFVSRDSFGRSYQARDNYPSKFSSICAPLATLKVASIIKELKSRAEDEKQLRKQNYLRLNLK